ncbi:MAG TPA: undecaprenyl diphosphate synthase family protein [Solirubrobacteraceae bacterium]|nr:undecaprenyl diphosphate synthase family protein [Solirubrobacteraceae bacterium]
MSEHLYAPEVPPIDLIIRTGGEQRLSNFMLWRAAYAELGFTTMMWPDITPHDIAAMLDDYATRARRFGR